MPYWDWDYPPRRTTCAATGDPREWVERFAHAFDEAVRLRLRADVPVACYLSGGIDSCAVLGFASRLSSRPLRAFTLAFDHADYDEGAIAARAGERCRAPSSAASTSAPSTWPITSPTRSITPSVRSRTRTASRSTC